MKKFVLPIAVAVAFGAAALLWWKVEPVDEPVASPSNGARIVFSADFATGNGCAAHNAGGCDVYAADIDWEGAVSDVRRLTSIDDAETFPTFSADGSTAYANVVRGGKKWSIEWISLADATSGTLMANAASPTPLPDGDSLVYISLPGYTISMADFLAPTTIGNMREVSAEEGFHEPHAGVTGQVVLFRLFDQGRGSNTAQVELFDPATGEVTDVTSSDGTAHCFWHGTGASVVCNNTELFRGLFTVAVAGDSAGASELLLRHPTVEQVAAVDEDFAECRGASYAYGTFCDGSRMIVTVGCGVETDGVVETTMSKLGLLDLSASTPTLVPLGKNLADAFGGPGSSSYTVDCMALPE